MTAATVKSRKGRISASLSGGAAGKALQSAFIGTELPLELTRKRIRWSSSRARIWTGASHRRRIAAAPGAASVANRASFPAIEFTAVRAVPSS